MLALVTAGLCFGVSLLPKPNNKIYAVESTKVDIAEKEYSALLSGGVIFSTEKVLIGDYAEGSSGVTTFLTEDDEKINFKDLQDGTKNKTVIDNGQFAVMENEIDSLGNLVKEEGYNEQEAIIVSFGAYVYYPETVDDAGNVVPEQVKVADEEKTVYSQVTYLDVVLEKDGQIVPKEQIPSNRNINIQDGGLFFDFVYLIKQDKNGSNEGFYKFNLNYMIQNIEYTQTFEFYVVNRLTYKQSINPEGKDFGYGAEPVLGWTAGVQFEQAQKTDGYVRYFIGQSGIQEGQISYPTITYDYTKYKLRYVHTANNRNTTYDFACQFNKTLNNQTAQLNYSVSSAAETYETSFKLKDYDPSSSINLVTIMLTEPGTYIVDYDFIYDGYNASVAPNIGIYPEQIKFAIHGFSANYSKTDYESAKLQYLELATKTGNHIDLFVPNGYEKSADISHLKDKDLGFVYSLVESEEREGNVLTENSINSLVNFDLKNSNRIMSTKSDFDLLVDHISNLKTPPANAAVFEDFKENINIIADSINYVPTNQGSIWINGNDAYTTDSFYYYSPAKLTADDLFVSVQNGDGSESVVSTKKPFTNTTSFNSKGYYFIFLKVKPSAITGDEKNYWQIFAFQYTSSSVDIKLEAINEDGTTELVAGGKHTNKEVRVSWKKPGIFDRNIQGYYYSVTNNNVDREALLSTQKNKLIVEENIVDGVNYYSAYLGGDVENGEFIKYLIRLESEGDSATHKIFTVDRQPISGVQPYLVEEMFSGNSIFYSFATDTYNYPILISNSITDSHATLTWDDKMSGAETFASYSYTPFVQNGSSATKITGNWLTTNYELGETINGSSLKKSSLDAFNLSSESILFNQGIYIIKIWDSAGNDCFYSFVIDKTENYFEVAGNIVTNSSLIFGDNVDYNIGQYKAFELKSGNVELTSFIQKATEKKLAEFKDNKYYVGNYTNAETITKYFQKIGDQYYFTVKNTTVVGYDTAQKVDNKIGGISGELVYDVHGESYYKRTIYAVAENQTYSTNKDVKNSSYVTVEINKDNARGMVYYSSVAVDEGNLPKDGQESTQVKRLDTGSDTVDAYGNQTNGMMGARATSAPHASFVWNMGTGNFEVEKVTYTFYSLKPNSYNNDKYYFYGSPEEDIIIYNQGAWGNNAQAMGDNSGRAFVSFNGSNESREGLYVVTRKYRDDLTVDLGDDVKEKNYYFIIDRNEIIDISQNIGSNIEIHLLENEIEFTDFSSGGSLVQTFSNVEDGINNQRYNVYLDTAKLPAVLNIPTTKYYLGAKHLSDYYAGQLNVSVYFSDIYGQLEGQFKTKTVKLFDSANESIPVNLKDGIFVIDIYKYLTKVNVNLRDRIAESSDNGTWLFLSGDYIIRITDNVKNELGETHSKFIGLRIVGAKDVGPQVDSHTGFKDTDTLKINENKDADFTYSATVSQEFLNVELPKYLDNVYAYAQVDQNYIVVKQYYGENAPGTFYVNHPYEPKNGINLNDTTNGIITQNNGSIIVWLDTKLRNAAGEVDLNNLNIPLYYTITVRYKIGDSADPTKYENCYVYYDTNGNLVKFYEATYTIRIDREAPKSNIDNLNKNDALVEEYNEMFETTSMLENGFHETSSNLYFTKQYAKYYQTNKEDKGYIYAYQVDEQTIFNAEDVSKVYYKQITGNDISSYNLTLPLISDAGYNSSQEITFSTYGGLLGQGHNNYYEIIEVDGAGNATQYVIHYVPSTNNYDISIPVSILRTKNNKEVAGEIGFGGFVANVSANADANDEKGINIYDITSVNEASIDGANFVKIELQRAGGDNVFKLLTTATTEFKKINQQIVDALKAERYGNFNLVLTFRQVKIGEENVVVKSFNINLYDKTQIIKLDIEKLIKIVEGKYYIDLAGANEQNADKTLWFFAQEIIIKSSNSQETTYVGEMNVDGKIIYSNKADGTAVESYIPCETNTTYFITMYDGIQEEPYKHRFKITEDGFGYDFHNVWFKNPLNEDDFGNYYSQDNNKIYYGYTSAMVEYDKTLSAKLYIKNEGRYIEITDLANNNDELYFAGENETYNTITINASYENYGKIIEAKIEIYAEDLKPETTYEIVIDTRLSSVALRDYNSGEQRDIIEIFNNKEYNDETVRSDKSGSGIMNLQWNKIEENEYFDYVYTLHELKKDDEYVTYDLTNETNYIIATKEDSKGIYKFEISVYGKNGNFLGNRVFAFEVQEVSTQIYYVRNEAGVAIKENSSFKIGEVAGIITLPDGYEINPNIYLPLYVTNENLTIVVTAMNVNLSTVAETTENGYSFKLYELKKDNSFNIFLGVLKVSEKESLFANAVNIVKTNSSITTWETVNEITSFTVAGSPSDLVSIRTTITPTTNTLLNKNLLVVDVYYNNNLVKTELLTNEQDPTNIIYNIKGNGQYAFEFKDLAGNVHKFENGATRLNVYVLREVVVTVNETAPIENAFYNGDVVVSVYASTKYVTGSVLVEAYKNGEQYVPEGFNPYVFSDYGTYRVVITALYNDGVSETPIQLKKVITFTIINVKEARKSIDLTSLNGSKITKVLNTYGEDKTTEFLAIINGNNGGMNISYENVIEYADKLNITAGKITFTITYLVEDGIYPNRTVDFSFTLNNETPEIECSLGKGETTKKNFKIYFNAAILYEQIGEAYIYINDREVAHIDENSANAEVVVKTSFKEHGDGDYYVKLVSSSGVVWDSYKVTIKEPLNFWAVLVIIVIVGVVATITITIIVLRRKMRIR